MRKTIIALDVHKRETQACVMTQKGKVIEELRFPTREPAYKTALSKFGKADAILETVGMQRPVVGWLRSQGHDVHLAVTGRIEKPKVKTDRKDAKHLADLYRADLLPEAYIAPEETQLVRDLVRQRQFLGQESRRLKAKIMHDLLKHGHFVDTNPCETKKGRAWLRSLALVEIDSSLTILEAVQPELERIGRVIEAEAAKNDDAKLLMTIPGVASYTALLIVAEVGDFRRFAHKDALASFAGLSIRQTQSGDNDARGSITRQGNSLVRWMLVQAARNHLHNCPESWVSKRHKRIAKRRGQQKAVIATSRLLITIMYAMITKGEAFKVDPF